MSKMSVPIWSKTLKPLQTRAGHKPHGYAWLDLVAGGTCRRLFTTGAAWSQRNWNWWHRATADAEEGLQRALWHACTRQPDSPKIPRPFPRNCSKIFERVHHPSIICEKIMLCHCTFTSSSPCLHCSSTRALLKLSKSGWSRVCSWHSIRMPAWSRGICLHIGVCQKIVSVGNHLGSHVDPRKSQENC